MVDVDTFVDESVVLVEGVEEDAVEEGRATAWRLGETTLMTATLERRMTGSGCVLIARMLWRVSHVHGIVVGVCRRWSLGVGYSNGLECLCAIWAL